VEFQLLGEYECKLDAKGRMRMPSDLIAQLEEAEDGKREFVVNRGFEKCLMIYPKAVWDRITAEINALNLYDKKNRSFVRYFYRGAQRVALDGADRILIGKRLLQYAQAGKEVTLMAYHDRIEVWDKAIYEDMLGEEPDDFSDLAQEVLGNVAPAETPDD
jgi:MraZ protein